MVTTHGSITETQAGTPIDLVAIREQVDAVLADFVGRKGTVGEGHWLAADLSGVLHDYLFAGGKRIRPVLCALGWYAAGGSAEGAPQLVRVAAALELFHAALLIHDDIIDNSETRRGRPTVHRVLAERAHDRPDPRGFGTGGAIVLGDLAMAWSDELLHSAEFSGPNWAAALAILHTMRTEVMYGQYLDLLTTGRPTGNLEHALEIIRYKTVSYTCERPLQIGAALAGASPEVQDALAAIARPLGEAFQLRDDLLGVYGDPAESGKSNLEDLRDGKHTVLLALALTQASPTQTAQLRALVGNPDLDERAASICRDILTASSARARVETMIRDRSALAQQSLDRAPFPPNVIQALHHISHSAVARTS